MTHTMGVSLVLSMVQAHVLVVPMYDITDQYTVRVARQPGYLRPPCP